MKRSIVSFASITALLLAASLSFGAANSPEATGDVKTIKSSVKAQKRAEVKKTKAAPGKVKLVDINSASKSELMKLPNIGEVEAESIFAGRPYFTKAHLVTRNILPRETYENLKRLVIAKQEQNVTPKPDRKRQ